MTTIKKLGLKRETVRTLKIRAGIQTGLGIINTVLCSFDTKDTRALSLDKCLPNPVFTGDTVTLSKSSGGPVHGATK